MHAHHPETPEIVTSSSETERDRAHRARKRILLCTAVGLLTGALVSSFGCMQAESQHWAQSSPILDADSESTVPTDPEGVSVQRASREGERDDSPAPGDSDAQAVP